MDASVRHTEVTHCEHLGGDETFALSRSRRPLFKSTPLTEEVAAIIFPNQSFLGESMLFGELKTQNKVEVLLGACNRVSFPLKTM